MFIGLTCIVQPIAAWKTVSGITAGYASKPLPVLFLNGNGHSRNPEQPRLGPERNRLPIGRGRCKGLGGGVKCAFIFRRGMFLPEGGLLSV